MGVAMLCSGSMFIDKQNWNKNFPRRNLGFFNTAASFQLNHTFRAKIPVGGYIYIIVT